VEFFAPFLAQKLHIKNIIFPLWGNNNHHEPATQVNKNRWFAPPVEFFAPVFGQKKTHKKKTHLF